MKIDKNSILKVLDSLYDNVLIGIPGTSSVFEFADNYLKEANGSKSDAIDSMIRWQVAKNSTNGFVSNLGGAFLLPISIPVELTSSIYIQLRTITAIAYLSGFDPKNDKVKTFCYCCLVGNKINDIFKLAGVEIGKRMTSNMIASISGSTLTAINQAVGFRLVTKFGEKGVINIGKWVPFVGGAIGATFEGYFTYYSANAAKTLFFTGADENENLKAA